MALDNRQLEVLQLLNAGEMTYKQIAKRIGVAEHTIARWVSGDPTAGPSAVAFSEEVKKLKKKQEDETQANLKEVQLLISRRLAAWARKLNTGNPTQIQIENCMDVLKTVTPTVTNKIDITQIYNGITNQEDMLNEFKRLRSLAGDGKGSSDRGAVSVPGSRQSDQVLDAPEGRGGLQKKAKGRKVSAQPQAGGVPQKPLQDKGDIRG